MVHFVKSFAEICAYSIEVAGIIIIAAVVLYVLIYSIYKIFTGGEVANVYQKIRQRLGHGILLGLELLVAADIIHTVAVEFTIQSVGVLGLIVLIRTFLSFSIEVELNGRWPWQKNNN